VRICVFVVVDRPFGRNGLLLAQIADKRLRVGTKSIGGELTEIIQLAFGIGGPGERRKQHGRAQAVFIAPLDGLYDEFLVAGAASPVKKKLGGTSKAMARPYSASPRSSA